MSYKYSRNKGKSNIAKLPWSSENNNSDSEDIHMFVSDDEDDEEEEEEFYEGKQSKYSTVINHYIDVLNKGEENNSRGGNNHEGESSSHSRNNKYSYSNSRRKNGTNRQHSVSNHVTPLDLFRMKVRLKSANFKMPVTDELEDLEDEANGINFLPVRSRIEKNKSKSTSPPHQNQRNRSYRKKYYENEYEEQIPKQEKLHTNRSTKSENLDRDPYEEDGINGGYDPRKTSSSNGYNPSASKKNTTKKRHASRKKKGLSHQSSGSRKKTYSAKEYTSKKKTSGSTGRYEKQKYKDEEEEYNYGKKHQRKNESQYGRKGSSGSSYSMKQNSYGEEKPVGGTGYKYDPEEDDSFEEEASQYGSRRGHSSRFQKRGETKKKSYGSKRGKAHKKTSGGTNSYYERYGKKNMNQERESDNEDFLDIAEDDPKFGKNEFLNGHDDRPVSISSKKSTKKSKYSKRGTKKKVSKKKTYKPQKQPIEDNYDDMPIGGNQNNNYDEKPIGGGGVDNGKGNDDIPIGGNNGKDAFQRMLEAALAGEGGGIPQEAVAETNVRMVPCSICGRKLAQDRIAKHVKACRKLNKKKRKKFDMTKNRVDGEAVKLFKQQQRMEKKFGKPKVIKKDWRAQHAQFQSILKGGSGPAEEIIDDRIPCPHCGRKFSRLAAERHIPKCKNIVNKPKFHNSNASKGKKSALGKNTYTRRKKRQTKRY